jgi:hypothetical protein
MTTKEKAIKLIDNLLDQPVAKDASGGVTVNAMIGLLSEGVDTNNEDVMRKIGEVIESDTRGVNVQNHFKYWGSCPTMNAGKSQLQMDLIDKLDTYSVDVSEGSYVTKGGRRFCNVHVPKALLSSMRVRKVHPVLKVIQVLNFMWACFEGKLKPYANWIPLGIDVLRRELTTLADNEKPKSEDYEQMLKGLETRAPKFMSHYFLFKEYGAIYKRDVSSAHKVHAEAVHLAQKTQDLTFQDPTEASHLFMQILASLNKMPQPNRAPNMTIKDLFEGTTYIKDRVKMKLKPKTLLIQGMQGLIGHKRVGRWADTGETAQSIEYAVGDTTNKLIKQKKIGGISDMSSNVGFDEEVTAKTLQMLKNPNINPRLKNDILSKYPELKGALEENEDFQNAMEVMPDNTSSLKLKPNSNEEEKKGNVHSAIDEQNMQQQLNNIANAAQMQKSKLRSADKRPEKSIYNPITWFTKADHTNKNEANDEKTIDPDGDKEAMGN